LISDLYELGLHYGLDTVYHLIPATAFLKLYTAIEHEIPTTDTKLFNWCPLGGCACTSVTIISEPTSLYSRNPSSNASFFSHCGNQRAVACNCPVAKSTGMGTSARYPRHSATHIPQVNKLLHNSNPLLRLYRRDVDPRSPFVSVETEQEHNTGNFIS
jgi:hypothetical protein